MCIRDRSTWDQQFYIKFLLQMGPYLSQPKKDKTYSFGFNKNKSIRYICCGMQGWRKSMEDAHLAVADLNDKYSLFAVFDGHGGAEVAKFCERHFPSVFLKQLEACQGNPEAALMASFRQMDKLLEDPQHKKELYRLKQLKGALQGNENLNLDNIQQIQDEEEDTYDYENFSCGFVGCTANVVLHDSQTGELIVANAGDAKCVMMKNGEVIELSVDHKPENEEEKDRILKAGGQVFAGRVNGNLNVSRAIGDLGFKQNEELNQSQQLITPVPDITKNNFTGKGIEFFIVGCDGVWEKMGCAYVLEKLQKLIKEKVDMVEVLEQLFDDIISPSYTENPKGCDNMSIVIVLNLSLIHI
eukprot:TRINITY_DN3554_c0_g1_i8.p1 TRINITY_DN3554_c0_g1~~TRINITY_DN3554_c0_g1_i8.p1  ORF type:complete len:356 (+),score=38.03 TRINITY_DN3554_c0_g1_i8:64-1131(+)